MSGGDRGAGRAGPWLAWLLVLALALALAALAGAVAADATSGGPAAAANDSTPTSAATDGGLVVTELTNRTLPLRNARSGPNEIGQLPGEVFVTVTNPTDRTATDTITLHRIDGTTGERSPAVDQVTLTLEPGNRTRVRLQALELLAKGAGLYRLEARMSGSNASGAIRIYDPQNTYFLLTTARAPTVAPGEPATIHVDVTNTGRPPDGDPADRRSPGMVRIGFSIDGEPVAGATRWIEVNETKTVALTVPADRLSPGSNRVLVTSAAEHDRRLDVQIRPAVMVREETTPGRLGPGFGVGLGVLAVALLAGAGLWRRGGGRRGSER